MEPNKLLAILNGHYIATRNDHGRIIALDVVYDKTGADVSQWIDLTDYTRPEVYAWLGY